MNTINLFEYSNKKGYYGDNDELEAFLDEIWNKRGIYSFGNDEVSEDTLDNDLVLKQKFLSFLKGNYIKSMNYIGVIKFNDTVINLLPKIFFDDTKDDYSDAEIEAVHANILWWLIYCNKFKFRKSMVSMNSIRNNFFEIFIYFFASYTRYVLSNLLFKSYEELNEEMSFVRGRIDIPTYVVENLSKAKWHKLFCIYDSFEFDNQFNRIIKYVSRLLSSATKNYENKRMLSDILFLLDEVSDVSVTLQDCDKVKLNPMFEDMRTVLDYCKLFIANSITYSYKNEFKVYAFLLPMEEVFEDFIFGFIEKHFRNYQGISNLTCQKSDLYLAKLIKNGQLINDKVFNLKHDIYYEYYGEKIIVDTKYKVIDPNSSDNKCGVQQNDLYQQISYAIRRKSRKLILIYPHTIKSQFADREDEPDISVKFIVTDEFSGDEIEIKIIRVPIIHHAFPDIDDSRTLGKNFEITDSILEECLIKEMELRR